jgi:hypothetical protein
VTCSCRSYNRPEPNQTADEVVLQPPFQERTVCVDACIADVVQRLWAAGVVTCGSCCGHNGTWRPSIVLESGTPAAALWTILAEDGRDWEVTQWRRVIVGPGDY